jgi:CMP-N-acetylneuraminic acid synthetase
MSKKSMKNVEVYEMDEAAHVDIMAEKIMDYYCQAKGLRVRLEIIRAVEDLYESLTEGMIPCMHCECAPVKGFSPVGVLNAERA